MAAWCQKPAFPALCTIILHVKRVYTPRDGPHADIWVLLDVRVCMVFRQNRLQTTEAMEGRIEPMTSI